MTEPSRSLPRLLVVADPIVPIPPSGYGGTERIVGYLIEELAERGFQITLIAAEGSKSPGRLVTFPDTSSRPRPIRGLAKLRFWSIVRREVPKHDLVHSVVRLDYLRPALRSKVPKVLNFQNHVTRAEISDVRDHARGPLVFTACGQKMIDHVQDLGDWRAVHNAVPVGRYPYREAPADPPYVVFLGRITPYKGVETAIQAARSAGVEMKIAGSVGTAPGDQEYFRQEVEPSIADGSVTFVGEGDDVAKGPLLGGATALLNPVGWDEPFGIVNVESLACGTPVIAFPRGEIPSIIRDGVTGWLVSDAEGMAAAIAKVSDLDRATCRREAEQRFDIGVMTDHFVDIYNGLLGEEP